MEKHITPAKRIDLKISFGCNNMCRFCVQGEKRRIFSAKNVKTIRRELEAGYASGGRGLVLTGGEPALHADLFTIIKTARKTGYRSIQLQSNGRMFRYADFCRALAAAGITEASPALHGSSAKIHDFLTGAPGSFRETAAGLANLKKAGIKILTNTVITKPNTQDLPAIARLLAALGADQAQFAFVHILGSAARNANWLVPKMAVIEPFVKQALSAGLSKGLRVMTEAIPYCFMSGYENCIAEEIIPHTRIFDAEGVIADFGAYRKTRGKAKAAKCRKCFFYGKCEGPWKKYPELFGWDEFVPRKRP
ncbi:MAG: hypothetical protein A2234_11320 [Elusimicrobia bacterium RIFOXYA2_FULL_58_8]|nr:MAG: hypothetical protein A2285_04950 [Elusimicrobia bacterium RIFOXYA12_FULL_57_11]OGS14529.1 MAG: hypothetical protein A2234_11320 [Elusimicrobia bacterium RIFOXYA2_FULL_58_8]